MTGRRSKTFCSILAESRLIITGDTFLNPIRFSVLAFVFSWWNWLNFLSSDCIGSDNATWIQTSVRRAWTVNDNFRPGFHGHPLLPPCPNKPWWKYRINLPCPKGLSGFWKWIFRKVCCWRSCKQFGMLITQFFDEAITLFISSLKRINQIGYFSAVFDSCSNLYVSVFKASPAPSQYIFEINVGKRRIRHRTTLNLNLQTILSRSKNSPFNFIFIICRIRLFPTLNSKYNGLRLNYPLHYWN